MLLLTMIYFQILRTVDEISGSVESKLIFDLQRMKGCKRLLSFLTELSLMNYIQWNH